ncbi:MAG TPA: hypothetical protein VKD23_22055, partial [Terriglobales bacterium]|nr:hypothetical protein [Terriglobales bacterium]
MILILVESPFWEFQEGFAVIAFAPIRYNTAMSQAASAITRSPAEIVQNSPVSQAPNGICYARSGEITITEN